MKAVEALLVILVVLIVLFILGHMLYKYKRKCNNKPMPVIRPPPTSMKSQCDNNYIKPNSGCSEPLTDDSYEMSCYTPANTNDGSYLYDADAGQSGDTDMQQCHQSDCTYDHSEYTAGTVLGPQSAIFYNHQKWLSEVEPWSTGGTRLVDDFRPEDYIDWHGIKGAPKSGVAQNNPLFVTEIDNHDLARWRENDKRCGGVFDFAS